MLAPRCNRKNGRKRKEKKRKDFDSYSMSFNLGRGFLVHHGHESYALE